MSMTLAVLMLAGQAATPPPPGLLFGFYRMAAFRHLAKGCGAAELDSELEVIRRRLIRRYGKKPFAWPKMPPDRPRDCYTAVTVYRVNLADFRTEAEAALTAPAPTPSPPAE